MFYGLGVGDGVVGEVGAVVFCGGGAVDDVFACVGHVYPVICVDGGVVVYEGGFDGFAGGVCQGDLVAGASCHDEVAAVRHAEGEDGFGVWVVLRANVRCCDLRGVGECGVWFEVGGGYHACGEAEGGFGCGADECGVCGGFCEAAGVVLACGGVVVCGFEWVYGDGLSCCGFFCGDFCAGESCLCVGGGGVVCCCCGAVEFFLLLFESGDGGEVLCGFNGDAVLFCDAEV